MFTTGASSRTMSRVERHRSRAIGMRPILATAAIAAAVVSLIVITPLVTSVEFPITPLWITVAVA